MREVVLAFVTDPRPPCFGRLAGKLADGQPISGVVTDVVIDSTVRPPHVRISLLGGLGGGRNDPTYVTLIDGRFPIDGRRIDGRFDESGT